MRPYSIAVTPRSEVNENQPAIDLASRRMEFPLR
jgi:hypothetical protein